MNLRTIALEIACCVVIWATIIALAGVGFVVVVVVEGVSRLAHSYPP